MGLVVRRMEKPSVWWWSAQSRFPLGRRAPVPFVHEEATRVLGKQGRTRAGGGALSVSQPDVAVGLLYRSCRWPARALALRLDSKTNNTVSY